MEPQKYLLVFFLVLISLQFVVAANAKLLCLEKGETLAYSKCNDAIEDRTCASTGGCQYCVTEISPGVYCPANINACNSAGISCSYQQKSNSENSDDENNGDDFSSDEENSEQQNNNENYNENSGGLGLNLPITSSSSDSASGDAISSNRKTKTTNSGLNLLKNTENDSSIKLGNPLSLENLSFKNNLLFIFSMTTFFEMFILLFLLYYSGAKMKKKSKRKK